MNEIPVTAGNPNQVVYYSANGVSYSLHIYMRGFLYLNDIDLVNQANYQPVSYFMDICIGDKVAFNGLQIVQGILINQYPSTLFNGGFVVIDITGNNQQPNISNFGDYLKLYYLDNQELEDYRSA